MIKSRNVDRKSPGRHWIFKAGNLNSNATDLSSGPYTELVCIAPADGVIKDFIFGQLTAGVGGTSVSGNLKKNGTTVLTTNAVIALASGANKAVDAGGDITLPSGATRPVLKTDGSCMVSKGDVLSITVTETGTYTTDPIWAAEVLIADRSVKATGVG